MKIKNEDVSERLEVLLEIVGKEKFLEIARMYGGSNIYIPTYTSAIKNARNREIIKRYNGKNIKDLARAFEISEVQVRNIIRTSGKCIN